MSDTIDAIKNAVPLTSLVEKKYKLSGNGRYLKAVEHNSLVIDTQKQQYHWNSKGESGDIIDWVGRFELNYNGTWNSSDPALFKEAVSWLAELAGIPLPQYKPEEPQARAQRMTNERLMVLAADYYRGRMRWEIQPVQYALGRGFSETTIAKYIGYSDGYLWKTIPDADKQSAADMGLIYLNDKNQWRDAIYRGNLIYFHYNHAKVEYMAGRFIEEKRHCNLRSPKRLFWAVNGYHGPLVVCEGQADALSAMQLGANALALCGTNLSDFDPDMLKLFDGVYIWQDADKPGSQANLAWRKRLSELAGVLGPLVRVITPPEGIKDLNEFLQTGASVDDMTAVLKSATTYLDTEIERISALAGAELYDELEPLFTLVSKLDNIDGIFHLNVYRSQICKKLNIGQGDFGRYLKAAKGQLSTDEEAEFSKGGQYTVIDGWTVLRQFTDDGKPRIMPLSNGTARIIEETINDDGSNDPTMDFVLTGELATGQKLPKITVPSAEYAAMKWTANWGSRFIIGAGRSTMDHLRAAVQHLSGSPYRRTIYTHTGWRKINGEMVYLTSAGALGIDDNKIQVDLKMGRPDTNMARYSLPLIPTDVKKAMELSLSFWNVTDQAITIPIWAAMYLAPLSPFLNIDFGLWVHGKTGSMKSSIVAAAMAHHGAWQGKDAKIFLPANFQSTSNSILMNSFQAKDEPLVIDDFAPGASAKEVRERDQTATNLLRSVGNKAARGRMRDGRHFQADFPPRCLAIITAEDLPPTASIMARGIGIRVQMPGKGTPERRAIEQRLTRVQELDSINYPHAMSAYILWIKRHWEELAKDLPQIASNYRDKMQQGGHGRLADAFGKIMAAVDTALYFAMDIGALTEAQAKERKQQAMVAMGAMMTEHGEAVESVDATRLFQEILVEQLDARQWYLADVNADGPGAPPDYPIGAQTVGYQDDANVFLLSKSVSDIMQIYQRMGQPFPVGRNTLYQRLIERGWLIPGEKATQTVYIKCLGTSPRVLSFKKKELLGE